MLLFDLLHLLLRSVRGWLNLWSFRSLRLFGVDFSDFFSSLLISLPYIACRFLNERYLDSVPICDLSNRLPLLLFYACLCLGLGFLLLFGLKFIRLKLSKELLLLL